MGVYYFVGSQCEIDGTIKLSRFGQKVTLPDDVAKTVIDGGGAILPEGAFNAIGFTSDELKTYAFPGQRQNPSAQFKEKFRAALSACHDQREGATVPPVDAHEEVN